MDKIQEELLKNAVPYAKSVKQMVKENSELIVDSVTLGQLYGGMRDVITMVTETSLLDASEGIRFRGFSIEDLYKQVAKNSLGIKEPLPEMMFLLLLLGRIPTESEITELSKTLHKKAEIPDYIYDILNSFPKNTPPMIQFTTVLSAMQTQSLFAKAYTEKAPKEELWKYTYEDALNILGALPTIVSYIYMHTYKNSKPKDPNTSLDWAGNLAHMIGDEDTKEDSYLKEFMRLYMTIHSDHEGGNASAHTGHLVGSTLVNPYGLLSASMQSLAGPLHGLANQLVLDWIVEMVSHHGGKRPTKEQVAEYIKLDLSKGHVLPGYGHAVLRKTDPRFIAQMKFAQSHKLDSDLLNIVWDIYRVAPDILGSLGKVKNPFPNVDAHSGAILHYFGFKESGFYTLLFGMSRSIGVLAQQVWDRIFMYPIDRPKSVTSDWVKENIIKK